MKKSRKRWLIVLGLLLLVGLIVIGLVLGWFYNRGKAFNSQPLVLIHQPYNNKRVVVGDRVIVHATAREDQGLERMELWADGTLIAEKAAPEFTPTSMVLSTDWTPTYVGHHLLIVQAVSKDGIQGQGTVRIIAEEAGQGNTGIHTVEEGDTLESIADEYGSSPEELTDLNPDLESGEPEPGEELIVPDDEPAAEEDPEPLEEDREAPIPEGDAPLMDFSFGIFELFTPPAGQVILRLEIPRLRTWESYDGLHCYVSLAGSLPQWYPDSDHDQATDESFSALDHGWWSTEPNLVGASAPVISWPGDQALPLTVSCVGVTGGGTEAVELGQVDIEIPPGEWDGAQHNVESDGEGGHLLFSTQVTRLESLPRGVPKYIDPDMTSPTNVRLNHTRRSLEWDYIPEPEEEPVDGFRIYLNGTLQWTEPADARESRLPSEWFNPPCASTYTFAVSAFRIELPDGPESPPGSVDLTQEREGCTHEIQITFLTLETFDLGGDGRYEDRHGDKGPAYGYFFANRNQIHFNGGSEGPGLDMPSGLSHNTTYNLADMAADSGWRFTSPNSIIVDVPIGGSFDFGYRIMDRDTGRCRDSDDPGCDDLICDGFSMVYEDRYGVFDRLHGGGLTSDNGRCRVTYQWGPAFDSPVGAAGEGGEPLPWLDMTDFYVNEATGTVEIEVRNGGTASWPSRDLYIELQTREGRSLGIFTWPDFVLRPGGYATLQNSAMVLSTPYDACVVIDPFDDVPEEFERSGAMYHNPICPQLPDLTIIDVYYFELFGERIRAVVQNVGDGPLENRTVEFDVRLPDGSTLFESSSYPDVDLAPGEIHVFEFPGLSASIREQMAAGYEVTINPDATILEENGDNNSFAIGEATRLWINWYSIDVPYAVRNTVEFHLDAYILTGEERFQVANWSIRQDIDWGSCFRPYHCIRLFDDHEYDSYWFDIYGDEELEIVINVDHPGTLREGYVRREFFTAPDWGGGGLSPIRSCGNYAMREYGRHWWYFDQIEGYSWDTRFDICRENFEE